MGPGGQLAHGEADPAVGVQEDRRVHRRTRADPLGLHLYESFGRFSAQGSSRRRTDGSRRRGRSLRRQALAAAHLRDREQEAKGQLGLLGELGIEPTEVLNRAALKGTVAGV